MSNNIPERARHRVRERDFVRCARCGGPATNGQWHHRRSRSVRDQWCHSPGNGLWMDKTCHDWVHAHPVEAMENGWIVSRHCTNPLTEPVNHALFGRVLLDNDGGYSLAA